MLASLYFGSMTILKVYMMPGPTPSKYLIPRRPAHICDSFSSSMASPLYTSGKGILLDAVARGRRSPF